MLAYAEVSNLTMPIRGQWDYTTTPQAQLPIHITRHTKIPPGQLRQPLQGLQHVGQAHMATAQFAENLYKCAMSKDYEINGVQW
jgi:hypothetical protein